MLETTGKHGHFFFFLTIPKALPRGRPPRPSRSPQSMLTPVLAPRTPLRRRGGKSPCTRRPQLPLLPGENQPLYRARHASSRDPLRAPRPGPPAPATHRNPHTTRPWTMPRPALASGFRFAEGERGLPTASPASQHGPGFGMAGNGWPRPWSGDPLGDPSATLLLRERLWTLEKLPCPPSYPPPPP